MPEVRPSFQLKGMAMGALLLALFGGGWMVVALNAEAGIWLLACALLPTSLLVLRAISLLNSSARVRALEPTYTQTDAEGARRLSRGFNLIFASEVGAIVVIANLLVSHGHGAWVMAAISLIVALSFLPLARLFRYPVYYATGGAQLLLCAIVIALMHGRILLADPVFGLVMALTLWLTVVVLLLQGGRWSAGLLAPAQTPDPAAQP